MIYTEKEVKAMRMGLSELTHYRDDVIIDELWGGFQDIKTRELYISFDAFGAPDVVLGDVIKVFSSFLQITGITTKEDYLMVSTVKTTEPVQNSIAALLTRLDRQVGDVETQQPLLRQMYTLLVDLMTAGEALKPGELAIYNEVLANYAEIQVTVSALVYKYLMNE
ncbi:hypothetical protein [Periweissella cryptocerci]|nr:hypothetical protein [Periweissella cryptocerci]